MKLAECTKAELLELLEALQSPSLGNERLSVASKYYIERYLNVLSDKRYDKVWKEYLQVQDRPAHGRTGCSPGSPGDEAEKTDE